MKFIRSKTIITLNYLRKHWKIFLFLMIVVSLIGFWRYRHIQANKPKYTFFTVQKKSLVDSIEVSGAIDAKEKARLRFIAGGKVTYLGAVEGEWVKKWQTIASIDKSTLKKQLKQDLNTYMKERWDWESTQDDTDYHLEELATRKTIDQEQWDLNNEVLDVEIRDIAIKNSSLYAPFSGILTTSPTNISGVQLLSTDYFELINPQTLIFRAQVDEEDIGRLTIGQEALIQLDAYENEEIPSKVSYISFTSAQSTTGTIFLIELPINSENVNKYRIGMNGDVTITLQKKSEVIAIPLETTISEDDKFFVNIKTDKENFEKKEIKVGLETDDEIEVVEGLNEGDEILIPE